MKYKTNGVCAHAIEFEIEENKIKNVKFEGGCAGNTIGISRLIEGMDIDDAILKLEYIKCGKKATSCPDQLATALKEYKLAKSKYK